MAVLRVFDIRSNLVATYCRLTLYDETPGGAAESGNGGRDLFEDRRYWYELTPADATASVSLLADGRVVRTSPKDASVGILDTKSQAGLVTLAVRFRRGLLEDTCMVSFEVLPAKFDLSGFRTMLDDICGQMLGLILRLNSMSRIPLRIGARIDASTIQQRFFFLQSLLGSDELRQALEQLTRSPHTRVETQRASRSRLTSGRSGRGVNLMMARGTNRVPVPADHPLGAIGSIPKSGVVLHAAETVDTPENRFVKSALQDFTAHLKLVESVCADSDVVATRRVAEECARLARGLGQALEHSVFRKVGITSFLPLGSPVLQRRPGYREVLDAWLKFHLAASLYWDGSEDVFGGGKRDTDKLYEYWLFFQLLKLLETELGVPLPSGERFLTECEDGLLFKLRGGRSFVHQGIVIAGRRRLRIRFSYNRTFARTTSVASEGSWTLSMRPDFTLSFWPQCVSEHVAEALHLTVHLHFDSKYRLEDVAGLFDESDTEAVKAGERRGNYKRADLFAAHAYRDAIRRSAGAYIIYPGSERVATLRQQYHEILPGLGAFPVIPKAGGAVGIERIGALLRAVLLHLGDYDSARERVSYEAWSVYGRKPHGSVPWPERIEVSDSERARPVYGEVLVVPPQASFPPEWIRAHGVLPLCVTCARGMPLMASGTLARCMAVLLREAGGGWRLVRFDREDVRFAHSTAIASVAAEVPAGVYAMLTLDFASSVGMVERRSSSVEDPGSIAACGAARAVTLELLTRHMAFLATESAA